jgi:hypothetical protein
MPETISEEPMWSESADTLVHVHFPSVFLQIPFQVVSWFRAVRCRKLLALLHMEWLLKTWVVNVMVFSCLSSSFQNVRASVLCFLCALFKRTPTNDLCRVRSPCFNLQNFNAGLAWPLCFDTHLKSRRRQTMALSLLSKIISLKCDGPFCAVAFSNLSRTRLCPVGLPRSNSQGSMERFHAGLPPIQLSTESLGESADASLPPSKLQHMKIMFFLRCAATKG